MTMNRRDTSVSVITGDERFQAFFEGMPNGIAIYSSSDGERFVFAALNHVGEHLSGVRSDEVIGREVRDVFPGVVEMGLYDVFRRVWASGRAELLPTSFYQDERLTKWYENRVFKLSTHEICAVYEDVTPRKQAEEALQKSERHFRTLFDTMQEAFAFHEVVCDGQGRVTDYRYLEVNPAFEHLTGLKRENTVGRTVREVLPGIEEEWVQIFGRVALTGEPAEVENYVNELDRYYRARAYSPQQGTFAVVFEDTTARRLAQQEQEQREKHLRVLLDSSYAGIIQVDPTGVIMHANRRMAEMFGCPVEKLIGSRYLDHVHPDQRALGDDRMRRLIQGEIEHAAYERHYIRADGSDFWGYLSGGRYEDEAGATLYLVGHIFDITERKRAEEALFEKERTLQAIIDASPECIKLLAQDGSLIMMNRAGLQMIEADSLEQVKGQQVANLVVERDRLAFEALTEQVFKGESCVLEFEAVGLHGRPIWLETHAVPFRNAGDEIVALLGLTRDITARKQIEMELAETNRKLSDSETIYRTLFERSPDGIQLIDPDSTRPVFFNTAMHRQLGYSREEFSTLTVSDYELLESREKIAARIAHLRKFGNVSFESLHRTKQGDQRNVLVSAQMITIAGTPRILSVVRDITDRKRAEEERHEQQQMISAIVESSQDWIWTINLDGIHTYSNQAAQHILGYTPDEISGIGLELVHPKDREMIEALWPGWVASQQGWRNLVLRWRAKDGSYRYLESTAVPIVNPQGELLGFRGVDRDITDRKKAEDEMLALERQLLHAQKLESLGVLAGGIAHDFNNILLAIIGNAELARMKLNPESPGMENLRRIETAASRAAELARQMLAYSGKGHFVVEAIDVNRLMEEMGHMLEVSISKKVVLRYDLTRPLPAVEADATQLRQVVMNLVINASEAIGDSNGVIAISTGCIECDRNSLKDTWLDENISEGRYVYLEVEDTGCGMDEETRAKIFDPFFTTKFTGRGLGMAAVLGIVRGHKGAITVKSEPGVGTTFRILLPVSGKAAVGPDDSIADDTWHGSGTVLLVDDEETVREVGEEMLKDFGFDVVTACDGYEALERYRSTPDIAFVILDLTMPRMDGEQCFRELRSINPAARIIISSGFSEVEISRKFSGMGVAGFIQKPYTMDMLCETIQRVTNERHRS